MKITLFKSGKYIVPVSFLCLLSLLVTSHAVNAQLTVSSITPNNAVQNVLLGEGITASNITYFGNANQLGSFNCPNCNLNIPSGIVMSSGFANSASGPNNQGSVSNPINVNITPDSDLSMIYSNGAKYDLCKLEFDFVPVGDSLIFEFVFASDEYPDQLVSPQFNDLFGFFLSGPGISGPFSNNSKNIALVPSTSTYVGIQTINNGSLGTTGPCVNCFYYNHNGNGGQTPYNSSNTYIQADGFTKILKAKAQVICGETYHIKMAIADNGDNGYNSWVFLKAGSFQSNNVEISYSAPNISPVGGGIYEGCETAYINFTRPAAQSATEAEFELTYTGIAINGLDFEELEDTLVFPVGQTTVTLPITAIPDGVLEGNETFTITVNNLGCNAGDPVSLDVVISDLPNIVIDMPDVLINCGEQAFIEPQLSGGLGNYLVTWDNGLVQPSFSTYPAGPVSFPFTVTDTCGVTPAQGIANVVFVQNPPLIVDIGDDLSAQCLDEIIVNSTVTGGFGEYSYLWTANGFQMSTLETLNFYEDTDQIIELTVTDICQVSSSDEIQLVYPPVPVTVNIGDDLTATCIDQLTVNSEVTGGIGTYTYNWTLGNNPSGFMSSVNVQTGITSNLVLNVSDQCGNSSSDALTITIPPVNIELDLGDNIVATCLDMNTIIPELANGIGNYSYVWTDNGEAVTTASQYSVQTGINRNINLAVTDQCGNTAQDQMQIIIPSVPVSVGVYPSPDTIICAGTWASLQARATGGVGNLTYTWTNVANTPTYTQNLSTVMESPGENSTYFVSVNDQCGNTNSAQMSVVVRELFPQFDSEYLSDTEIRVENLSTNYDHFLWSFGNGNTSEEIEETVDFLGALAWTATLTVFSPEGCSKSLTQEFTAVGDLFVPNSFTPDSDGVNDMFFAVGHDLRYFELTIFNRYGEVVYKSFDINEPWDGSHQGSDHFVPNGVYNYQLVAIGKRENTINYKGKINVIR